ncbi:RodZ domain-containing protein [Motilimonas pumila]|uniref:DUF4115 domain-containing protein n=1 Tax=Motilimonas pumila TaxID=2303987 RepID=A0A418YB80_9GAMM|nr:RodZ domain-containing protein [Motilimonas pumila]RJG40242.1 DUF4115 domain-containing protein [Motilimonas pumila]
MNTDHNDIEHSEPISVAGPGQLLKEAREALNLSQEDIASRLNLRAHNIHDIETDDYDPKVPTAFIKGYLKAYARIVGVSEFDVLDAFKALGLGEAKYANMQSFSQRTQQEAQNTRLTWVSYAVGISIVAALVWWWLQKPTTEPATSEQLVSEELLITPAVAAPIEEVFEPVSQVMEETDAQLENVAPQGQDIESSVAEETQVTEEAAQSTPETVQTTSNDEPESTASTTEAQGTAEPIVASNELSAELSFSNDCWIKVTDAEGKELAIGVKKGGDKLTVTGTHPLKFIIGAPQAITISYNNTQFDMSQFQAGKIARFQLPE